MNSLSREEIDARFATVEARLEGHIAAIRASIDALVARMDIRDKLNDERSRRTDQRLAELSHRTDERFARLEQLFEKTQEAITNLKMTTVITAISAVIAVVLGVGAINAALLSNMIAAFQAGGNMASTQAEVKRQVEETAVLLKQLQTRTVPPAVVPEPAPPSSPKR